MAKIVLTVDGAVLKELVLTKERISIGRRPHNDLMIDHVAISGEHAVIVTLNKDSFLEDLNSTNGTQVNGQPIKKHFLQDNDSIDLAPYKIKFIADTNMVTADGAGANPVAGGEQSFVDTQGLNDDIMEQQAALIRVLTGPSAGKELMLSKPLTTIGRPGVQVAVVARRKRGYFVSHVEGESLPLVNGETVGVNGQQLKYDDIIDLSGTQMVIKRNRI